MISVKPMTTMMPLIKNISMSPSNCVPRIFSPKGYGESQYVSRDAPTSVQVRRPGAR